MTSPASATPRPGLGPDMTPRANPRVCLVSQRGLTSKLPRCCGYEFEDVITAIDEADLVAPTHRRGSDLRLKVRNKLSRVTPLYRLVGPGVAVETGGPRYDLFFMLVQFTRDLMSFDAVRHLRMRSDFAVCFLEELWLADIGRLGPQLDILKEFDYIFCSCAASVQRLADKLRRPVEYMPPGVDAIRFCPNPRDGHRCIQVAGIGRRSPVTHKALIEYANETGKFYIYDSLEAPYFVKVPHEHRILLANQVKHSRYFIANKAKFNRSDETADQAEIGFRYFEGLAGGAVLLGDHPRTEQFERLLGWEDSVIPAPFDCPDMPRIIRDLDQQPARLRAIRRRNVRHVTHRHDWCYRWQTVLQRAGMTPTDAMRRREAHLKALAAQFDDGEGGEEHLAGNVAASHDAPA